MAYFEALFPSQNRRRRTGAGATQALRSSRGLPAASPSGGYGPAAPVTGTPAGPALPSAAAKAKAAAARKEQAKLVREYVTDREKQRLAEQHEERDAEKKAAGKEGVTEKWVDRKLDEARDRAKDTSKKIMRSAPVRRANREGLVVTRKGVDSVAKYVSVPRQQKVDTAVGEQIVSGINQQQAARIAKTETTTEQLNREAREQARSQKVRHPGGTVVDAILSGAGAFGEADPQHPRGNLRYLRPPTPQEAIEGVATTVPLAGPAAIVAGAERLAGTRAGGAIARGAAGVGADLRAAGRATEGLRGGYKAERRGGAARSVASVKGATRAVTPLKAQQAAAKAAETAGRVPLATPFGKALQAKPVRTGLKTTLAATALDETIESGAENVKNTLEDIGDIDPDDVKEAVETAVDVGKAVPGVLLHSGEALLGDADVREESLKGIVQAGIASIAFPFVLGKDIAQEGVGGGIEKAFDPIAEDISRRWTPALEGDWKAFEKQMAEPGGGGATFTLLEALGLGRAGSVGLSKGIRAPLRAVAKKGAGESIIPSGVSEGAASLLNRLETRPGRTVTSGEGGTLPKYASEGIIGRGVQAAMDAAAKRVSAHAEGKVGKPKGRGSRELHRESPDKTRPSDRGQWRDELRASREEVENLRAAVDNLHARGASPTRLRAAVRQLERAEQRRARMLRGERIPEGYDADLAMAEAERELALDEVGAAEAWGEKAGIQAATERLEFANAAVRELERGVRVDPGAVVPILKPARTRQAKSLASRIKAEETLSAERFTEELLGKGRDRYINETYGDAAIPHNARRGIRHFAQILSQSEWDAAVFMARTGMRDRAGLQGWFESRKRTLPESSPERQLIADVEKLLAKGEPAAKVIRGAEAFDRIGRALEERTPALDTTARGSGRMTEGEAARQSEFAEQTGRDEAFRDAERRGIEIEEAERAHLEAELGITPTAKSKARVQRAVAARKHAQAAAISADRRAERFAKPEVDYARERVSKIERSANQAKADYERIRTDEVNRAEKKARTKAERENKQAEVKAEREVARTKAALTRAQESLNKLDAEIAARQKRGQDPLKRQLDAREGRVDRRDAARDANQKALREQKKVQREANEKVTKAAEEARQKAADNPSQRVKTAEQLVGSEAKRLAAARKLRTRAEQAAYAHRNRVVREAKEQLKEAEKAERALAKEHARTTARERELRGKGSLHERTWRADRIAYTRSVGPERLRQRQKALGGKNAVEPGYIPDIPPFKGAFADRAANRGKKGATPKASTGWRAREGLRTTEKEALMEVYSQQINGTALLRINRRMAETLGLSIVDVFGSKIERLIGRNGMLRRPSRKELDALAQEIANFPEGEFVAVNVGRFTQDFRKYLSQEQRDGHTPSAAELMEKVRQLEAESAVQRPAKDMIQEWFNQIEQNPAEWQDLGEWRFVRKNVAEQSAPKPPGPVAGTLAWSKGLASRMILGLNPQWLGFQVYANAMVLGLGNPRGFLATGFTGRLDRANLPPAVRESWEMTLGLSRHMPDYGYQGAHGALGWMAHRAGMEQSRLYQSVKGRSLLTPMFTLDYKNNRFWKNIYLTDKVKREAIKDMDARMANISVMLDRISSKVTGGKVTSGKLDEYQRRFNEVAADRPRMEQLGREVDRWMGDYLRFTSNERAWLVNNVMFYGFLRHSLTIALSALPRSPIKANILAKMGQVALEDQKEMLRRMMRQAIRDQVQLWYPRGETGRKEFRSEVDHYYDSMEADGLFDDIPLPMLGDFYFEGPIDVPILGEIVGEGIHRIQTSRAAALGNVLLESRSPWQLLNVINPFVVTTLEAAMGYDFYTGQQIRTDPKGGIDPGFRTLGAQDAARHMMSDIANLVPPIRGLLTGLSDYPSMERTDGFIPGLFPEEPMQWKEDWRKKVQSANVRRFQNIQGSPLDEVLKVTAPFIAQKRDPMSILGPLVSAETPEGEKTPLEELGSNLRNFSKDRYGKAHSWSPDDRFGDDTGLFAKDEGRFDESSPNYRDGGGAFGQLQSKLPPDQAKSKQKKMDEARKNRKVVVPDYVPAEYRDNLEKAERDYGVPATLLAAQIQQESGFDKDAGSRAGAQGISQFMPDTAAGLGVDPWDPDSAIDGQARMMKGLLDQFGGNVELALAGYNAGAGAVEAAGNQIPDFPETQNYVASIKAAVGGSFGRTAPGAGATPKKHKGAYAGSKAIVRELIGKKAAQNYDWKDKEDRGDPGGTLHDIGTENGYAADLSEDTSEKMVDIIAKKLGLDPDEVNYGTTGLESGITYKGYDIEFLPYTHGSGPHIHIGAQWTGGSLPAGTTLGGGMSATSTSGGVAAPTGSTSTSAAPATPQTTPRQGRGAARRGSRVKALEAIKDRREPGGTNALLGVPSVRTDERIDPIALASEPTGQALDPIAVGAEYASLTRSGLPRLKVRRRR
jgi:hypothetical protein